jgi:hypothetical protein
LQLGKYRQRLKKNIFLETQETKHTAATHWSIWATLALTLTSAPPGNASRDTPTCTLGAVPNGWPNLQVLRGFILFFVFFLSAKI